MNKQAKIILFSCMYILGIISFLTHTVIPCALLIIITAVIFKNFEISTLRGEHPNGGDEPKAEYVGLNTLSVKYLCLLLFIFITGIFNTQFNLKYDDNLTSFSDNNISADLKVLTIPANSIKDKTKFFAKVYSIYLDGEKIQDIDSKTFVTITDEESKLKNIQIGDILKVKGRLKTPDISHNPSQFDYAGYLQLKDTFSLIYVDKEWEITGLDSGLVSKVIRKLNKLRNNIISIHAQNIKSPMLEVLGGVIFGDDAVNPDEDVKNNFMDSGIFHILAASGMNVTLIFGIWFFFAKNLRFNYKFSILAGIFLIFVYTCMTGFGPPIIRAFLMLTLILAGKLIDRQTPTLALLFLVAFLMLVFNPLMILDIGFQLSFIVTFALIITAPLINFNFKHKVFNYLAGGCLIPIIAQIFSAPLQLYYFNTFALYSVFANIAIVPVLSIVSFLGFLSSILALIPLFADKVCYGADLILNPLLVYIIKVAELFSKLPHSIIYLKRPSIFQIVLYFIIVTSLIFIFKFKKFNKKVLIPLFCIILLFLVSFIKIPNHNAEIIFFSVGNADSILLKTPDNNYFLIDTGKTPYLSQSSQAKNIILKYFQDNGIEKLKGLILSHFDSDHAGGTIDILKKIPSENVYITSTYENTDLSSQILDYIKENNINSKVIYGDYPSFKKNDYSLNIIRVKSDELKTENEKSLVVLAQYKDNKMLFMGDGNVKTYNTLPEYAKQNITIMKSGHHGAKGTVDKTIADNTELFIISTGPNVYNHPNPETIKVIEDSNTKYLRTDYHNAIKIIMNNNKTNVFMYSPVKKKFIKSDLF